MTHPADDHVADLQRQLGDARTQRGLSKRKVAEDAQIDVDWLEAFEAGYESGRSPTVRVMERVANAVGKTLVLADLP